MFFEEWSRLHLTSKRSIPRAATFADAMGVSLYAVPTIVVVGSKGKATAATEASAALVAARHRVGTITSPPILTNRERIRLDGVAVDGPSYDAIAARAESALRRMPKPTGGYLSPSGIYMVAGIDHLCREGCDVLVIEAGMGGRSDEVSLLDPQVLVVTPIFLEHVGILGNTIEEIRAEKLGAAGSRTIVVHDALQGARLIDPHATLDRMTMHLPGRMTTHVDREGRNWLIDAAVNAEGVARAVAKARPEFALVSLPDGKDVAQTAEWLDLHMPGRWVAVIPPMAEHLSYAQWPRIVRWDPTLVEGYRNVVAAGSWSFMSAVLAHVGVETEVAFTTRA